MAKREKHSHREDQNNRHPQTVALDALQQTQIAARAYELWQQRGCPDGSPQEDWTRAEEELRHNPEPRVRTAGGNS